MLQSIIAAAQSKSLAGDVQKNLTEHLRLAQAAAKASVSYLMFPELSSMGYELSRLSDCVISAHSRELHALHELSRQENMTIGIGAAVSSHDVTKPFIATLLLQPNGNVVIYKKRFLHESEAPFATAGTENCFTIEASNQRIALAICADTVHSKHARWASQIGASIYAASVLWSIEGYASNATLVEQYAKRYNMAVLVANHASPTGGYASAGQSAFWALDGQLLCSAPAEDEGLLIATCHDGHWRSNWQSVPSC